MLELEILLSLISVISILSCCYTSYLLKKKNDELLELSKDNNLQYDDDNYNYYIIEEKN